MYTYYLNDVWRTSDGVNWSSGPRNPELGVRKRTGTQNPKENRNPESERNSGHEINPDSCNLKETWIPEHKENTEQWSRIRTDSWRLVERESSLLTTYWSGSTDVFGVPASRHGSLHPLFQVALHLPYLASDTSFTAQLSSGGYQLLHGNFRLFDVWLST